jgi:hypothetical protein
LLYPAELWAQLICREQDGNSWPGGFRMGTDRVHSSKETTSLKPAKPFMDFTPPWAHSNQSLLRRCFIFIRGVFITFSEAVRPLLVRSDPIVAIDTMP